MSLLAVGMTQTACVARENVFLMPVGPIPLELGHLGALKTLRLDGNILSGESPPRSR